MKSIFSKEQNKYLQENYNKKSYKEIAEILGFTERQIRGRINNILIILIQKKRLIGLDLSMLMDILSVINIQLHMN